MAPVGHAGAGRTIKNNRNATSALVDLDVAVAHVDFLSISLLVEMNISLFCDAAGFRPRSVKNQSHFLMKVFSSERKWALGFLWFFFPAYVISITTEGKCGTLLE